MYIQEELQQGHRILLHILHRILHQAENGDRRTIAQTIDGN